MVSTATAVPAPAAAIKLRLSIPFYCITTLSSNFFQRDEVAQAQTHPFDTTQPPPEDFPMYDQTPQDYYEGSYDTGNYDYSNDGQQQDQNQNYY